MRAGIGLVRDRPGAFGAYDESHGTSTSFLAVLAGMWKSEKEVADLWYAGK